MRVISAALVGIAVSATLLRGQARAVDTVPEAVVQRFVDAANAVDIGAMMAAVAPEVVFASLPSNEPLATGRDSVKASYERMFARQPIGVLVKVESRMADGAFVVDHEHFQGAGGRSQGHATWIYHVTGGLIRHAWVLRQPGVARR